MTFWEHTKTWREGRWKITCFVEKLQCPKTKIQKSQNKDIPEFQNISKRDSIVRLRRLCSHPTHENGDRRVSISMHPILMQRRLVNLSFFLAPSNLSFLFVDLNCFEKNFPYLRQALVFKVGRVRLVMTSSNDFVFCPGNGKHRWYRIASAKNLRKQGSSWCTYWTAKNATKSSVGLLIQYLYFWPMFSPILHSLIMFDSPIFPCVSWILLWLGRKTPTRRAAKQWRDGASSPCSPYFHPISQPRRIHFARECPIFLSLLFWRKRRK